MTPISKSNEAPKALSEKPRDPFERIMGLHSLYQSGVLTEAEYIAKRDELLLKMAADDEARPGAQRGLA